MSDAGEGASPPPAKKSKAGRVDFTKDSRFEQLVPIFGVNSVSDFNRSAYRLANFQMMAAALETRATGANCKAGKYRSWMEAIECCIKYAAHHNADDLQFAPRLEEEQPQNEQPPAAVSEKADEDDQQMMAKALAIIEQLLSGEEISEDALSSMDDALIDECVKVLSRRCDDLEAAVRSSLDSLEADGDKRTVAELVEIAKV